MQADEEQDQDDDEDEPKPDQIFSKIPESAEIP